MSARYWMKEPCKHCPFREDVPPFLHPDRGAELAYGTQNKYQEFFCHKTLEHDDECEDGFVGSSSLVCAGHLSMQVQDGIVAAPNGFTPSPLVYGDCYQMADAYEDAGR